MRTIFISSFHAFVSHFVLGSPLLGLLKKEKDLRVVLLVPRGKKCFFEEHFGGGNIVVEDVEKPLTRIDSLLSDLAISALNTKSVAIRRVNQGLGWVFWYTPWLFLWAPLIRPFYRKIYAFLTPPDTFGHLFDKYRPTLVFSADLFSPLDCRLMHTARSRGVAMVGMVRSWDNLTTKGLFRVTPDKLVVANEIQKTEAMNIHGFPEHKIRMVGIPLYDIYTNGSRSSRDEFLKRVGADPKKRIVLFSPIGDRFFARNTFDRDVIEMLSEVLPPTHQLLVRFTPVDSVNLNGMKTLANVIFDRPGTHLSDDPKFFKKNELSPDDDDHLVNTLCYSDVVVLISTTLAIDAAVFDRPLVVVGFHSQDRIITHKKSTPRLLEYNHIQPLLRSGGVRVAKTKEALKAAILDYISDPSLDRKGRKRVVREQCVALDGQSSQRLMRVLRGTI